MTASQSRLSALEMLGDSGLITPTGGAPSAKPTRTAVFAVKAVDYDALVHDKRKVRDAAPRPGHQRAHA